MTVDDVVRLHRSAMEAADQAIAARLGGAADEVSQWIAKAFNLERQAALMAVELRLEEPTLSVLLRSAATLAFDAGEPDAAARLAHRALAGAPPPDVEDELMSLLETVTLTRHLRVRGVELRPGEFQVAIHGPGVGYGVIPVELYMGRVGALEKAVSRTAERKLNRPYRDRGRRPGELKSPMRVFLSAGRASSYAVTFRVGESQELFPDHSLGTEVVVDVVRNLELLNDGAVEEVAKNIRDPAYLRNFLALAEAVAPDGAEVTGVGFTLQASDHDRAFTFERTPAELREAAERLPPEAPVDEKPEVVEVEGYLRLADNLRGSHTIKLEPVAGKRAISIDVPEGLMDDIVRPHWGSFVRVTGERRGRVITLRHIEATEE